MKGITILLIACLLTLQAAMAQPQKFNYQGIARNANGNPLANQMMGLQITILDGSATGPAKYIEQHIITTNAYGLYNVAIGGGNVAQGSMADVQWENGDKYINVAIDPSGGTNFTSLGTTQLLSVPYALYAASGTPGPQGPQGPQGNDGPTGPQGPQGAVGATGPQGLSGPAGPVGPAGPQGTTGAIGPIGPIGPTGATGAAGPQGPAGPVGPQGPAGPAGPQGPVGNFTLPYQNSITTTGSVSVFDLTNNNTTTGVGTIRAFASSPSAPGLSGANLSTGGAGVYGEAMGSAGTGVYGTGNWGVKGVGTNYGGSFSGPTGLTTGSTNPGGVALELNGGIKVTGSFGRCAFTVLGQTSSSGTDGYVSANTMLIDNPFCNNEPNAMLLITHNWSAGGNNIYLNNKTVGVYYAAGKWRIFLEDGTAMPLTAFNVLVIKQ